MIVIELEGKEYNMPTGWHEVSVGMFEEIVRLSGLYQEYVSQVQYTLDIFQVLTGAPIESLKKMSRKSFDELSKRVDWVNEDVVPSNKDQFQINNQTWCALKNLDSLEMGDAISLELVIKDSNEANILSNILPLLIRKSKEVLDGENTKIVAGSFDAENYEDNKRILRENLMVPDVIGLKSFF